MFVDILDTIFYLCIMILICLLGIVFLGCAFFQLMKIWSAKRKCGKCSKKGTSESKSKLKPGTELEPELGSRLILESELGLKSELIIKSICEKEIAERGKKCGHFIAFAFLFFCISGYLFAQRNKYAIPKEFALTIEERNAGNRLRFEVVERQTPEELSSCDVMLHTEWYDNRPDDEITIDFIEMYMKNVDNIFSIIPEKEDRIDVVNGQDVVFMEKQENFRKLVGSRQAELSSELLWEGYKDGLEVCRVFATSENCFQTGVLAESASQNAYKSQQSREVGLNYVAGMVNQFENFLEFKHRDAGGGMEISEVEICFRMEKGLYRVSRENWDHDNRIAIHCGLFGYSCSQYAVEKIDTDDSLYLIYLDNSGLNCLNIIKFIDDKELCAELCRKELKRWECLDETNMSKYKTEGKTLEEVKKTKSMLQSHAGNGMM